MSDITDALEILINQGRYFEARAKAASWLGDSSPIRSKQLYALALSKCGVPEAAMQYLEPLYKQFPDDPETAGILGGIYKEIFIKTKDQRFAVLSKDTYLKNFNATKSYYTGINAATMSAVSGQAKQGQLIASEVIALLNDKQHDFWELATLAESYLISKDRIKAKEYYLRVRNLITTDWGKINSIYNQLWLLNHYVAVPNELLNIFKPPVIAAFIGHMIDHPNRTQSRFPASIENAIKEALTSSITSLNAKIGYCSLACGGDILFAEAMAETGGEVNIFLPFEQSDFIETSIRFAGDQWVERFDRLVKKFPVTFVTHEPYDQFNDLFVLQTGIIFGAAVMRSAVNHTKPHLFTLMSSLDSQRKVGGTRDTSKLWPYPENITNINPDNFSTSLRSNNQQTLQEYADNRKYKDRPVCYILLADFPNTSPTEKESFWKSAQSKMEMQSPLPLGLIWNGEAILVACKSLEGVTDICRILFDIVSRFQKKDNIRISLHVGPVFVEMEEESIGKKIEGNAVKILQEIHHYSTPGEVYASSQFALEMALAINQYSIDYGGKFFTEGMNNSQEIFRIGFAK